MQAIREQLSTPDTGNTCKRKPDDAYEEDTTHPAKQAHKDMSSVHFTTLSPLDLPSIELITPSRNPPILTTHALITVLTLKYISLFLALHKNSIFNAQPYNLKGDGPHPPPRHHTELLGITINSKQHKNTIKRTALKQYINTE